MSELESNPGREAPQGPTGFWVVEPRVAEDGTPDINFRVLKAGAPVDQRELKNSVERALTIVKALYKRAADKAKLQDAIAKLISLSQVGLVGAAASPTVALDALRALEADILERESGPIKNQYMRKLGGWAASFGVIALLVYFYCFYYPDRVPPQVSNYRNVFLVWAGCMAGAWASFASRKPILSFSDLVALEEDRIEPALRLVFTGILTIIFTIIFTTGLADIKVGGFHTSSILKSGSVSFLLGAFAGLAEKTLPSAVLSRANNIIISSQPTKS